MRIAVINEISARDKNKLIIDALKQAVKAETFNVEIFNIGMNDGEITAQNPELGDNPLTYIHTGLMAAVALNTGAADFAIGGCGTGQGFLLSAMQYPGVACGLISDPLDAWLFSQINGGNCVSLALNKGFGWAGDINLRYIFEKLFSDKAGQGYPAHRAESQKQSRRILSDINAAAHKPFGEILNALDKPVLQTVTAHKPFTEFIYKHAKNLELRRKVCGN